MPVYSYDPRESLEPAREGISYSIDKMKVNAHAAQYAPIFEDLRAEHAAVRAKQEALNDKQSAARARVHAAGENLCDIAHRLCKQVLSLTGEDRGHPLYQLYFGDKTFADFKKPLLLGTLDGVRGWQLALDSTLHAPLKPFAAELKASLAVADEAIEARLSVEYAKRVFREDGERKQFFDKLNAARKQVYGQLDKLPFQHVGLPRDFADRFFTHRRPKKKAAADAPTVESVKDAIDELKTQLTAKEQLLVELSAAAEEAKQRAAEIAAEEAEIEALEKQAAEALALVAKKKTKIAAVKAGRVAIAPAPAPAPAPTPAPAPAPAPALVTQPDTQPEGDHPPSDDPQRAADPSRDSGGDGMPAARSARRTWAIPPERAP